MRRSTIAWAIVLYELAYAAIVYTGIRPAGGLMGALPVVLATAVWGVRGAVPTVAFNVIVEAIEHLTLRDPSFAEMLVTAVAWSAIAFTVYQIDAIHRRRNERLGQSAAILRTLRDEYETIFNSVQDAVSLADVDKDGAAFRYRRVNPAYERLVGLRAGNVAGRTPREVLGEALGADVEACYRRCVEARAPISYEAEREYGGGKGTWQVTLVPVMSDGRVVSIVGAGRDLTPLRGQQEALRQANETLDAIIRFAPLGIMTFGADGKITSWSPAAEKLYGWKAEEVLGHPNPVIPADQMDIIQDSRRRVRAGETLVGLDGRRKRKDGSVIEVRGSMAPLRDMAGNFIGHVAISEDISSQKQAERALAASEAQYRSLVEASPDGIAVTSKDGKILMANERCSEMLGYSGPSEMIGRSCVESIVVEQRERAVQTLERALEAGVARNAEFLLVREDGSSFPTEMSFSVIKDPSGTPTAFAIIMKDITERKRTDEQIRYISLHDSLTGLYNRLYFEEHLRQWDTPRQYPLSVIMGDVNGLKLANDAFGHEAGDQLLTAIAHVMRNWCRMEDIVARWGGDEFVVLLPKTSEANAQTVCDRIKNACEKAEGTPIPPSISLGTATKTDSLQLSSEVLRLAEERMYRNKLLESRSARSMIVSALLRTLYEKTQETEEHTRRLAEMGSRLGRALGLADDQISEISLLAAIHDLGKVGMPGDLYAKPSQLTGEEWAMVRKHPEIGYRIAQASPDFAYVSEAILCHHERWDGAGYPRGLKGAEIPLTSRILFVVDAYDAITSDKPYRPARTHAAALDELRRGAGTQFDPEVVAVFVKALSEG
jgi:diguanylate cyclase (GGDEF)-like protein/PAS domain S-box-containing protein